MLNFTYILIGINVLLFIAGNNQPQLIERMMLQSGRVRKYREYDRLFLSGFAHAGLMHLVFNMLTLYYFGPVIESIIGATLYLFLFLFSIIAGNLYCLVMRREEPNYAALGASGGVMGIIYAFILLAPEARLSFFFIPVGIPGWLFGILFSVISIVLTQLPRAEEARISHEGHLGGALAGGLFMLAILGNGNLVNSQLYFVLGGLLPIIGFLLVKLLLPKLLYRHLNR